MRFISLLFIVLFLSACGPKEGQVWENVLTQKRIEVEYVGTGAEIAERYERLNEFMEGRDNGYTDYYNAQSRVHPRLSASDSLERCIAFEVLESMSAPPGEVWVLDGKEYSRIPYRVAYIISIDEFKDDYVLIK